MGLTGANAILRKLGSIGRAIETGIFIEAVEEWAKVEFIPRAQALVPKDTYELHNSISFDATKQQVFVFASAPHASHVEFGTYLTRAQPYIRPAYQAARPLLSRYTRRRLREVIR